MLRQDALDHIRSRTPPWDILIIGGGATGLGIAVDAASRGYDALLLEQCDFAKGTSSRSTKLVHGGVRYLQQGNISLVMEALKERGILRHNAPHLVYDLAFVVPSYDWWESPFYGVGLKVYDMLAGKYGFGRSRHLSRDATIDAIPTIQTEGLRGGTLYYDGQFDDARLAIALARTAHANGASLLNHAPVTSVTTDHAGLIDGVSATDLESGEILKPRARVVINATGPFADAVRLMDNPDASPIIAPSQGVHVVLDRSFLPGETSVMVPHTDDGRVLFAIPWQGRAVIGTTDTPLDTPTLEPRPLASEIEFLLEHAARYLSTDPTDSDVKSAFAGIRPLVRAEDSSDTAALSREHTIHVARSGLVTVAGGKWTTYRKMAEDAIDHAVVLADLEHRPCVTRDLPIHGSCEVDQNDPLAHYGTDADLIRDIADNDPSLATPIHPDLPATGAEIVFGARFEMARTVEDALSRRTRSLLLDARASAEAAPAAARLLAAELDRDEAWQREQITAFQQLAAIYTWPQ